MSATNMMKKVFNRKSVKKDWAPISMMAKFVREKDLVSFEESPGEVLVAREKETAVAKAEEVQSALMASDGVRGDVIEIQDFEENNPEKENTKKEAGVSRSPTIIYLWTFVEIIFNIVMRLDTTWEMWQAMFSYFWLLKMFWPNKQFDCTFKPFLYFWFSS